MPSFVVCTANDATAAACLSAASFAARISLRLWLPSASKRCLRTLISRLASDGTNFRFLEVPSSSSTCAFCCCCDVEDDVASAPSPLALVIHAGKFDTPRCPESVTLADVTADEVSVDCCCCCCNCCC